MLERIYSPKAFFARLTTVTRELYRPKLPVKFDAGHWRRNARVFRRLAVEITDTGHEALSWVRSRLVTGYEHIAEDEVPKVISYLQIIAESLDGRASEVYAQLAGES